MDLGLKGKVAVVTGGTKGIGLGCAQVLAQEGANLVLNYRSNPEDAELTAKTIAEKTGVRVITVQGDISLQETVDKVFDAAIAEYGAVDIIINSAGGGGTMREFETLTEEEWKRGFDNNLNGAFRMCRKFVGYWKGLGRGGHIVNVISKACLSTNSKYNEIYASAKGGLLALTRCLAHEVTPYGIYVNCIAPGYVKTERLYLEGSPEYEKRKFLPTGEFAEPKDMGAVVAFLCSDKSSQVIGAVVDCTGGMLL